MYRQAGRQKDSYLYILFTREISTGLLGIQFLNIKHIFSYSWVGVFFSSLFMNKKNFVLFEKKNCREAGIKPKHNFLSFFK